MTSKYGPALEGLNFFFFETLVMDTPSAKNDSLTQDNPAND